MYILRNFGGVDGVYFVFLLIRGDFRRYFYVLYLFVVLRLICFFLKFILFYEVVIFF